MPDYEAFYTEEDLRQEEPRVLGECFRASTIDSLVATVTDVEYDPDFYIIDESLPRPVVPRPGEDCRIMTLDAVPEDLWEVDEIVDLNTNPLPADFWDEDKVVDIQMGNEVWTVNSALVDAGFWDTPFVTNPGAPFEEAAAQDPSFWEDLVIQGLEQDLVISPK